jgi:hypothetical protein
MSRSSIVRRTILVAGLAAAALLTQAPPAMADPSPNQSKITQPVPYLPPTLTPEYIDRETKAGRANLPASLRAYPNCITALPLIVTSNPTREAIIPVSNAASANCVMGVGNQGYAVRELQKALNACRGAGLVVDGIYGQATKTAVKNAQITFGITADGVYGPVTRSKPIWPALTPYSGCWGFSY